MLLGDGRIPHVVEVRVLSPPQHGDLVSAAEEILGVERLVDVAEEVDDELQRHLAFVE